MREIRGLLLHVHALHGTAHEMVCAILANEVRVSHLTRNQHRLGVFHKRRKRDVTSSG
jgi:hypothetical protein